MANISNIMDDQGSSQGALTHLGTTDDSLLTISGTGNPNATINVYQNGVLIGHSQTDEQGLWVFQSPELEQGLHQFTVSETDANGLESLPSQAFQVSVDQEAITASELAVNGVPKAFVNGDQLSSGEHHFSGKAEANSTVEVYDKGEHIGTTNSDAKGNWSLSVDLEEGQHELSTTVKDDAGNTSQSSEPVKLEVLALSNPANGTGVTLPPGTSVADGGYNNISTPLVSGTATAKAMVYLSVGDQHYGPIEADDQGNWQVQILEPLDEGEHLFRAKAVNDAGTAYDGFTLTIDTIAPDAPTIDYANDDVGAYQGRVEHEESTDDDAFSLHGQGAPNDIIAIYHGNSFLGTTVVKSDGSWEYQPTSSFLTGQQTFFAIAFDKAGNRSDSSKDFEVTVDRQVEPPKVLYIVDDEGPSTGEVNDGGNTDDIEPLIVGSAEKGALVHVYIDGAFAGFTRADENSGEWELQSPLFLDEGQHEITAKQYDLAENESTMSDAFTFTVSLNQAPDAVDDHYTISKTTKFSVLKNDGDSDGDKISLSEIVSQGQHGSAQIKNGKIIYRPSGKVTEPQQDTIVYKIDDGNGGTDTATVHITLLPPHIKPTIDLDEKSDSGRYNDDNITKDNTPELVGTATIGSQVIIYKGKKKIAETSADSDGKWSFTTSEYDDGNHSFKVVSVIGNEKKSSSTLKVTIDTEVEPPIISHLVDDLSGSKNVSPGETLNDPLPEIHGTSEPHAEVIIYVDGKEDGRIEADVNGNWVYQVKNEMDDGSVDVRAKQIDIAGNVSPKTQGFEVEVQSNQGPDAKNDRTTTTDTVKVNVLANDKDPDGDKLKIEEITKQGKYGSAKISKSGEIVYELDNPASKALTDTVTYRISDGRGGFDTAKVIIDIVPPLEKPTIDLKASSDSGKFNDDNLTNDTTPTFTGTATAGTTITLLYGKIKVGEGVADSNGSWTITSTHLNDGNYNLKVVSSRGDESKDSDPLAVTIDTVVDANVVNIGRTYNNAYDFTGRTTQNGGKVDNGDSVYHARASEIAWRLTTTEFVDYKIKDIEANNGGGTRMNSLTDGYLARAEGSASSDTDIKPDWFRNISGDTSAWDHVWYTFQATLQDLAGNELVVLLTPTLIDPIAALKDGGYIVTYASLNASKDGSLDIWAQRYDVNGNTVNEAFVVNSFRLGEQANSDVTGLEDGGFLVTWQSYDQDGDGFGIFAQRYDANSEKVGGEFQVNQYYSSDQSRPEITSLENGGFAVSWMSDGQDGNAAGVYLRVFSADGNPRGNELQVNSQSQGNQALPSITELSDGLFAVSWHANQDESGNNIWAKIYDQNGNVIKDDFILHDDVAGEQFLSNIRSSSDGGFIASWVSTTSDGANEIQIQSFSASGEARFEHTVNISPTDSSATFTGRPEVSGLSDGDFVVVWSEVNDGVASIYSSRYSSAGEIISTESIIAHNQHSSNIEPHIVTLEDGGYLITWTSIDNNSGTTAVFGQRFNSNGESFSDVFEVGTVDGSFDNNDSPLSQKTSESNNGGLLDLDEINLGFEGLIDSELTQAMVTNNALTAPLSQSPAHSSPLEWSSLLDGDASAEGLFSQLEVEIPELNAAQFSATTTEDIDSKPSNSPDFPSSINSYGSEQLAQELEQLLIIQADIDIHP
ncbi:Ig-like domain-containing protein [uncultured Pseudoteredinibacter sp.]|uniref:Ig-like domain-containing protein n=1 Tax=uncultured Pseudoteredinibacter sp. TaxID=1641701 RepID=UPI00263487CC|nr:Ig-like domain-containing protein [uncultured Pseudoteredinibacter sp.]